MRHRTVIFSTLYISLLLLITSLFPWYEVMYKYISKNDTVKLTSALKYTHLPVDWHTNMSQFMCGNWTRRNFCWSPSIWSQMFLHWCITLKRVINPWPAPDHNRNDYWHFTYDQKRSDRNLFQTPVILTVSMLHQRTLQGRWYTHKSELLLPLYPLSGGKLVSLMIPQLTN